MKNTAFIAIFLLSIPLVVRSDTSRSSRPQVRTGPHQPNSPRAHNPRAVDIDETFVIGGGLQESADQNIKDSMQKNMLPIQGIDRQTIADQLSSSVQAIQAEPTEDSNQSEGSDEEVSQDSEESPEGLVASGPGHLKFINGGAGEGDTSGLMCKPNIFPSEGCFAYLDSADGADIGTATEIRAGSGQKQKFKVYELINSEMVVNFENPDSMVKYLGGAVKEPIEDKITPVKACRLIASGCATKNTTKTAYQTCVNQSEKANKRSVEIGFQKTIAIWRAAEATTQFEPGDNFEGTPVSCKGNAENKDGSGGGYAFDYPQCRAFVNWYTVLEASQAGFQVGNDVAVATAGMKNQRRLQQQVAEGNGQDAGFEAARLQSVTAQKAEERSMAFFSAKAAAITGQLTSWVGPDNVCEDPCCQLFSVQGPDRIGRDFFPNKDAKQHIIAQLIKAGADITVAKMKADAHKRNAQKVQAIKDQVVGVDEGQDGVMKFCIQFPQDVRCLGPGERRGLGASGTQFGSFQGSNFGLGSLEGQSGSDASTGGDFGGNLAAGGKGSVANIGDANKEAAAAKSIFNAPPAARAGGGGGAAGGGAAGGGAGASAQAGQLSRDEGAQEEKPQAPIEITGKKANYEGSKGGYNGGGYNPSNKKPADSAAANPFASMFKKGPGRDPANTIEIDKPASDIFAKISRRYGEVQKRKGLLDVAEEDQTGIR